MKTLTIRDFRTRPNEVRKAIVGEPQSLLTASGKPFALVIPVNSESLDETMEALKLGRGQAALRALRDEARRKGLDQMTTAEVETVIATVREARHTRGSRAAR